MKLGHVLQSSFAVKIDLNLYGSMELKRAARFWVGKEAGSFTKEKCIAALTRTMADGDTARRVLAGLTEKERQVLGIFARYGPTVSGGLLTAEVYTRGIIPPPPKNQASDHYYQAYRNWSDHDPVPGLREKFVLVGNYYDSNYSSYNRHRYSQLTLHPTLAQGVAPAPPVAWHASHARAEAVSTGHRSSAQVGLDLWRVAEVLRSMGTWQTVKGDSPAKATRARLQKEVGLRDAEKDPMSPPDAGVVVLRTTPQHGLAENWGQAFMDPGGNPGAALATATRRTGKALGARLASHAAVARWHWRGSGPRQQLRLGSHRAIRARART